MCWERAAATSAIAVACGTPMPSTPRVVQAAPGRRRRARRRAGAHEVQAGRVRRAAAEHDRDRQLADELLEVERVALRGDVLGRDDRALDDQDVQPGVQTELVVALDALRSERRGGDDAVRLDLLDRAGRSALP
jgi:hypothetical protein